MNTMFRRKRRAGGRKAKDAKTSTGKQPKLKRTHEQAEGSLARSSKRQRLNGRDTSEAENKRLRGNEGQSVAVSETLPDELHSKDTLYTGLPLAKAPEGGDGARNYSKCAWRNLLKWRRRQYVARDAMKRNCKHLELGAQHFLNLFENRQLSGTLFKRLSDKRPPFEDYLESLAKLPQELRDQIYEKLFPKKTIILVQRNLVTHHVQFRGDLWFLNEFGVTVSESRHSFISKAGEYVLNNNTVNLDNIPTICFSRWLEVHQIPRKCLQSLMVTIHPAPEAWASSGWERSEFVLSLSCLRDLTVAVPVEYVNAEQVDEEDGNGDVYDNNTVEEEQRDLVPFTSYIESGLLARVKELVGAVKPLKDLILYLPQRHSGAMDDAFQYFKPAIRADVQRWKLEAVAKAKLLAKGTEAEHMANTSHEEKTALLRGLGFKKEEPIDLTKDDENPQESTKKEADSVLQPMPSWITELNFVRNIPSVPFVQE
ncbi:hypothetical protein EJ08DRAFT_662753 [Tothia fuscella]|uniref:Uncharacterized protein n=1 Tax=Tothia fuscella TaxID=1048955 RepID=A0A9P4NM04_9PEZI|nr:hypothetical protein EJ08DRAFT_662753 [Tothia fuscella]